MSSISDVSRINPNTPTHETQVKEHGGSKNHDLASAASLLYVTNALNSHADHGLRTEKAGHTHGHHPTQATLLSLQHNFTPNLPPTVPISILNGVQNTNQQFLALRESLSNQLL